MNKSKEYSLVEVELIVKDITESIKEFIKLVKSIKEKITKIGKNKIAENIDYLSELIENGLENIKKIKHLNESQDDTKIQQRDLKSLIILVKSTSGYVELIKESLNENIFLVFEINDSKNTSTPKTNNKKNLLINPNIINQRHSNIYEEKLLQNYSIYVSEIFEQIKISIDHVIYMIESKYTKKETVNCLKTVIFHAFKLVYISNITDKLTENEKIKICLNEFSEELQKCFESIIILSKLNPMQYATSKTAEHLKNILMLISNSSCSFNNAIQMSKTSRS